MGKIKKAVRATKGQGKIIQVGAQSWGVRWTDTLTGKRRWQGSMTYPEAQLFQFELSQGRGPEPTQEAVTATFGSAGGEGGLVPMWFASRKDHRNQLDDINRWKLHLDPTFQALELSQVTTPVLSILVSGLEAKTKDVDGKPVRAMSGATIERVLYLLSGFYRWAIGQGYSTVNPVVVYRAGLTKVKRKALHTKHDPKKTPFLEKPSDSVDLYKDLAKPYSIAYALSRWAGLRPGEVRALQWSHVNLTKAVINVSRSIRLGVEGPTKSGKDRDVPIVPGLLAILKAYRKECPADTLVVSSPVTYRNQGLIPYLNEKGLAKAISKALGKLGLPGMSFYHCGRHSFASGWVIAGNDIYQLSKIMGHSSVVTTERYSHLGKVTAASVLAKVDVALS